MTRRRARGEGSIHRRKDGLWTAALTVGYDQNGKRKRKWIYGKTRQVVRQELTRLQSAALSGTLPKATRWTVAGFLEHWFEGTARTALRKSTVARYEGTIKRHIIPHLGGIRLASLEPSQIQNLYTKLEKADVSAYEREYVHVILHKALGQGVKWGYLIRNVCGAVQRPRIPLKIAPVLTAEHVEMFFAAAREDRLFALYVLAVTTGARQGELLALEWPDIDFAAGTVSFTKSLEEVQGKLSIGETKTKRSRRRVQLTTIAIETLKEHRKKMLAERRKLRRENSQSPLPAHLVFCDTAGGYLRKSNLRRRSYYPILKKAGLPKIKFHSLRHTAATLLLEQGVHPAVMSAILGHASVKTTLDIYSHVSVGLQQDACDKLDQLLNFQDSKS
jgi:integrase